TAGAQRARHPAEREVHAHDLVALVDGARCGDGGINPATHRCQNLHRNSVRARSRVLAEGDGRRRIGYGMSLSVFSTAPRRPSIPSSRSMSFSLIAVFCLSASSTPLLRPPS